MNQRQINGNLWVTIDPKAATRLSRADWKGWLAVAWVIWWGSAYTLTVLQARAPGTLNWLRSWTAGS